MLREIDPPPQELTPPTLPSRITTRIAPPELHQFSKSIQSSSKSFFFRRPATLNNLGRWIFREHAVATSSSSPADPRFPTFVPFVAHESTYDALLLEAVQQMRGCICDMWEHHRILWTSPFSRMLVQSWEEAGISVERTTVEMLEKIGGVGGRTHEAPGDARCDAQCGAPEAPEAPEIHWSHVGHTHIWHANICHAHIRDAHIPQAPEAPTLRDPP